MSTSGKGAVLVTGAAGFVGRHVVARLRAEDVHIVPVEHAWDDIEEVAAAVGAVDVARCIHLGWYAHPADYLTAVEPNLGSLRSSVELVQLLGRVGCRHLVVAGTSAEYRACEHPVGEGDAVGPMSVYGATKAAFHLLLGTTLRPPGMRVAWTRLFNLTGPGEHPDRLLPWVTRSLRDGRSVDLSAGEQIRDFLDVEDVAAALVALSLGDAAGVFNVSSGQGVRLRDLLTHLAERVGRPELLRFGARPYGADDPMCAVGRNEHIRRATGWLPAHDTGDMLDRVVAHWRAEVGR